MEPGPEDYKIATKIISTLAFIFLFIFGFWQSWSGVFIYILGFWIGAAVRSDGKYKENNESHN